MIQESVLKEHFGWKIAICQHPMYLLIDEDRGIPEVGERVPPWGAATAADYVERVRRNLASLGKFPDLFINYEFSGVEIDMMARDFPDLIASMRQRFREGKLDFIGGTFSQPHMQIIGSESNWRQFELGLGVFKKLFGKDVKVHFLQETGFHQQMPQILRQFGFEFTALPPFPWAMEVTGGTFELVGCHTGVDTILGDEFIEAEALDGTSLPAYIKVIDAGAGEFRMDRVMKEAHKDLYSGPPIWTYFPDLVEVDENTYRDFKSMFDFVLLDKALPDRFAAAPPRARARVYTYWSYVEGVWGEELLRANRKAEEAAVLAEQMCCMARLAGSKLVRHDDIHRIWHAILKSQHHDIYWIEVTDLRRKAIEWLDKTTLECRHVMGECAADLLEIDDHSVTFFNGLPFARTALIECASDMIPDGESFQMCDDRAFGFVDLPSGGYRSYGIAAGAVADSSHTAMPGAIGTEHYHVEFSETGLMRQLTTTGNDNLLKSGSYLGGEIRAMISGKWFDNRAAECSFMSGKVMDVLERKTAINEIPVHEKYFFFREHPLIKVELDFEFNGNEAGHFPLDETKLNVYYPTAGSPIYHDIPFGFIEGRENRVLFAINWLYCGGLLHINRGNVKHWVRDGVIANMIAWGGNIFSNRMHYGFWNRKTQYDIRLYGKHRIEYYLVPRGRFHADTVANDVQTVVSPVYMARGRGQKSFYRIDDRSVVMTSLYERDGQIWSRGFKTPKNMPSSGLRDWEIFNKPVTDWT
ncbi:MAG: hypothetical protein WCK47_04735 [bacterium]|nr:hypothetical protein [Candidatus Sumerlaeota bacterium]